MKVALLSDIHGNAPALSAVLSAAASEGVSLLLCCGDYVGYYYDPEMVFDLLDGWSWLGVRGNHEDMLERWLAGEGRPEVAARYGSGVAKAAQMRGERLSQVLSLPKMRNSRIEGRRVLVCHGAPWDGDAYVYPDAPPEVWHRMAASGDDLVVYGHTHYPVVRQAEGTLVVNPGSVGQPRDRRPGACWALWDTETMSVALRRENYDAGAVAARCAVEDPHLPAIAQVLTRTS